MVAMTHLTQEQLVGWRDHGAAAERGAVLGHLAACEACRGQLAAVARLAPQRGPQHFDPAAFVARGRAVYRGRPALWRLPALWIGLPAAAALVVALLVPRPTPSTAPSIEVRGSDVQTIAPAGEVAVVREFRWSSPFRASRYHVIVRDSAGEAVLTDETAAERYVVPPEKAASLRAGRYSWTVEAKDAAGRVIAGSRPRSFTLGP